MHGRSADRLDDPCRQIWKVAGDTPGAGRRSHVGPRQLREALPFIVDEVLDLGAWSGLKDHHLDTFLSELIAERTAAGAGADNYNNAIVVLIEFRHDVSSQPDLLEASDFRQPIDVVETALDVATMLGGRALIAESRPKLFLVVERDDEIGADLLEEIGLLDPLQQNDPVGFPGDLRISDLVPILRVLIETPDAIFQHRLDGRILGRLAIPRLDGGDVIAVDQEVVRIDVACNFYQRLQGRGRQRRGVVGPRILDADPGAGRDG